MFAIPTPSEEQQSIIDAVEKKFNVMVDAVAGSGKSTLVFQISKSSPNLNVFQITFNKDLKNEVRKKAHAAEIKNLEVHTYHSLAVKYYDPKAFRDDVIKKIVKRGSGYKLKSSSALDLLIIDEAQDMTPLYYELISKFINECKSAGGKYPQMVVMGDKWQSIYEFKDSDARFLTHAGEIWKHVGDFVTLKLSYSYRLTTQIAAFVNNVMLGEQRIVAKKQGVKVHYFRANPFSIHAKIFSGFVRDIKRKSINPGDIFVVAASVNSAKSPIRRAENYLVSKGIPCYTPSNDDELIDDEVTRGKVVFTSFHQTKGRERPVVILYGFDKQYFDFFGRDLPSHVCPKVMFVAATRASKRLIIIENNGKNCGPLPFLKKVPGGQGTQDYVQCGAGEVPLRIQAQAIVQNKKYSTSPTELTRFIRNDPLEKLSAMVSRISRQLKPASNIVDIPLRVKNKDGGIEDVSAINGMAIPSIWESKISTFSDSSLEKAIKQINRSRQDNLITTKAAELPGKLESISDHLFACNIYNSYSNGVHFKIAQIDNYEWLSSEMVDKCCELLDSVILADGTKAFNLCFENKMNIDTSNKNLLEVASKAIGENVHFVINGSADCVTSTTLWEFKCVGSLTMEHILQLCVYAFITESKDNKKDTKYKIINIRSGEIIEIMPNMRILHEIVETLVREKYQEESSTEDNDFVKQCVKVSADVPPPRKKRDILQLLDSSDISGEDMEYLLSMDS